MPNYHLRVSHFSRSAGQSATAAVAYRGGLRLVDDRTGEVHDYTRKKGVLHSELVLPAIDHFGLRDYLPPLSDRAAFWNEVERHHKRGDAVTAREVEVSLPADLDAAGRKALALQLARSLADEYGVAADVSLHAPREVTDRMLQINPKQHAVEKDGQRHNGNWHAHIVLTACSVTPGLDSFQLGKKVPELDPVHCQRHKVENVAERFRERWADMQNQALECAGIEARVDHRTLKAQGVERAPTVHLGPAAAGYTRRTGQPSRIALEQTQQATERLRQAQIAGEELRRLNQSIIDVETALSAALAERDRQRAASTKLAKAKVVHAKLQDMVQRTGKDLVKAEGPAKRYSGQAVLVERPFGFLVIDHGDRLVGIHGANMDHIEQGKHVVASSDDAGRWHVELHPRQIEFDRRVQVTPSPGPER